MVFRVVDLLAQRNMHSCWLSFGEMELCSTLEACEEVYLKSVHKYVCIDEARLREFALSVPSEELEESTKDSEVNQRVDQSTKAAVFIAYNAVNFSFYPDEGKKRWFAQAQQKSQEEQEQEQACIGKDDEAHAVVYCLHRAQSTKLIDLADGAALAGVSVDTVSLIFKPHPGMLT